MHVNSFLLKPEDIVRLSTNKIVNNNKSIASCFQYSFKYINKCIHSYRDTYPQRWYAHWIVTLICKIPKYFVLRQKFSFKLSNFSCPILQALISSTPLRQVDISLAVTGNLAPLVLPVSQTQPLTGLQAESASADSIDRLPCMWSKAHRLYESLVPRRKRGLVDGALCC